MDETGNDPEDLPKVWRKNSSRREKSGTSAEDVVL
jgi:hypothetical protein